MLSIFVCYLLFPVQSHHVGDQIVVYADVVAPKNAPVESYWISHLPFCMHPLMQAQTMYQALTGHKKIDVGIHLTFGKDMDNVELCEIVVNETGFVMFRGAIERDFAILLLRSFNLPFAHREINPPEPGWHGQERQIPGCPASPRGPPQEVRRRPWPAAADLCSACRRRRRTGR